MKKSVMAILSFALCLMLATTAFAAAETTIANAERNDNDITFDITLSEIPEGLENIAAITVRYSYDKDDMKFESVTPSQPFGEEIGITTTSENGIAWFAQAGKEVDAEAFKSAEGVLFNVKFTRNDGRYGDTTFKITTLQFADSKLKTADVLPADVTINLGTKPSSGGSSGSGGGGKKTNGGGTKVTITTPPVTKPENPTPDTPSTPAETKEIADLAKDHWAYESAKALLEKGIISGDAGETVNLRPNDAITREEASKIALLAVGATVDDTLALDFTDAASVSDWAKSYIATAAKLGIISGYEDGSVRSKQTITREEMITLLLKAFNRGTSEDAVNYADSADITWSKGYIAKAASMGIITGYEDNTIRPKANITRAEVFALIYRCMNIEK